MTALNYSSKMSDSDWSDLNDSRDGQWDFNAPGQLAMMPSMPVTPEEEVWFDAAENNGRAPFVMVARGGNVFITINENNDNSSVMVTIWGVVIRLSVNLDSWRRFLAPIARAFTDGAQLFVWFIIAVDISWCIVNVTFPELTTRFQNWLRANTP